MEPAAAMMNDVIVVHYGEATLKLGHRARFVGCLVDNLRKCLRDLPCGPVRAHAARVIVEIGDASEAEIVQRLAVMPGIANCLPARRVAPDIEALESAIREALRTWSPTGTFAVRAKRADKSFPLTSPEIGAHVGAIIGAATGASVDLKRPDDSVHVIVVEGEIYLSFTRIAGCGGLPVSTGGRLMLLLSGGIDSPVAGLRMMRRGCRLGAVHFHSVPYLSATSQDKARQLAAILARGQGPIRLNLVAFGDTQAEIVRFVPRPLRVVLYRRMMLRIACALADKARASALVTGESLGQVASQTLVNMSIIERASPLPVLRPLVGMDKLEISRYADREGTYEISIVPDQDCCTLFVPKHPATAARADEVAAAESLIDVERLVGNAVETSICETVEPIWPAPGETRAPLT